MYRRDNMSPHTRRNDVIEKNTYIRPLGKQALIRKRNDTPNSPIDSIRKCSALADWHYNAPQYTPVVVASQEVKYVPLELQPVPTFHPFCQLIGVCSDTGTVAAAGLQFQCYLCHISHFAQPVNRCSISSIILRLPSRLSLHAVKYTFSFGSVPEGRTTASPCVSTKRSTLERGRPAPSRS